MIMSNAHCYKQGFEMSTISVLYNKPFQRDVYSEYLFENNLYIFLNLNLNLGKI